jgi:FixJ family two-component response regulator
MPDMDGIELLIKVKAILPSLPVLIVTGYGDVPMAVGALKAGAADFLEKPLDRQSLVSVVEGLLKRATLVPADLRRALTKTETSVLRLILTGKNNKEIAMLRHRSVRTIEDHRRRIMAKLGAHNLVDLIKRVAIVRFPTLPTDE